MRTSISTVRETPEWLVLAIFAALAGGSFILCGVLISRSAGLHDFVLLG